MLPAAVSRKSDERRPFWRLAFVALLALFAGFVVAAPAQATSPHATEATTAVTFVSETVENGSNTQLSGTWSLPDNPATPAGFSVPLPDELVGVTSSFPMTSPTGAVMGQCTVDGDEVHCDLDAAYVAENPLGLKGAFEFWATLTLTGDPWEGGDPVTYDHFGSITVTPSGAECEVNCYDGNGDGKWGRYVPEGDSERDEFGVFHWSIHVQSAATGRIGGERIVVVDELGANHEYSHAPELHLTNRYNATGGPDYWIKSDQLSAANLASTNLEVTDGGSTVSFTALAGYHYEVRYFTNPTDNFAQVTYSNKATVSIDGVDGEELGVDVVSLGGNATGVGTNVGKFTITKAVTGSGAGAVTSTQAFTGTYTVTMPPATDITHTGTYSVTNGATWMSPEFPRGSQVTLTEVIPTEPATVAWATPVFSQNAFTLSGGSITGVTLTNDATLLPPVTGSFSASKALVGTGTSLVPTDATFTLNYTYPAGANFVAGTGSLVLKADGKAVPSGELPVGAVLTFTEASPTDVTGGTWGTPVIAPETLTITAGASATEVVVTNPITTKPTPTPPVAPTQTPTPTPPVDPTPTPTTPVDPTPTPTPTPRVDPTPTPTPTTPVEPTPSPTAPVNPAPTPSKPSPSLATTGSSNVVPAALGLGLLVLGGAALLFRRRNTI